MPEKTSADGGLLLIELVGPLVDGRANVAGALGDGLGGRGVELRPGALDQVGGMALPHAIRTLLEGHGRHDLLDESDELELETERALAAWAATGPVLAADGALDGWRHLAAAGRPLAVLTALPLDVAVRLAERIGLVVHETEWLVAADGQGTPRADHLSGYLAGRPTTALVGSIGAALATAAAGCHEVIAVGNDRGAVMLADRSVPAIGGPGTPFWAAVRGE